MAKKITENIEQAAKYVVGKIGDAAEFIREHKKEAAIMGFAAGIAAAPLCSKGQMEAPSERTPETDYSVTTPFINVKHVENRDSNPNDPKKITEFECMGDRSGTEKTYQYEVYRQGNNLYVQQKDIPDNMFGFMGFYDIGRTGTIDKKSIINEKAYRQVAMGKDWTDAFYEAILGTLDSKDKRIQSLLEQMTSGNLHLSVGNNSGYDHGSGRTSTTAEYTSTDLDQTAASTTTESTDADLDQTATSTTLRTRCLDGGTDFDQTAAAIESEHKSSYLSRRESTSRTYLAEGNLDSEPGAIPKKVTYRLAGIAEVIYANNNLGHFVGAGAGASLDWFTPDFNLGVDLTGSIAFGEGNKVLEEITGPVSSSGISAQGTTTQEKATRYGVATDLKFGANGFFLSIGGELVWLDSTNKSLENISKNGEIIKSNTSYVNQLQFSPEARLGLGYNGEEMGFEVIGGIDGKGGFSVNGKISYGSRVQPKSIQNKRPRRVQNRRNTK